MEFDPLAREFTPDHIADFLRHGLPDSESRPMSPNHLAFHERVGDTGVDTQSLYQDAMKYQPRHTEACEAQYETLPATTGNHRHHHRHGAVSIPLEDFDYEKHQHSSWESAERCRKRRKEQQRLAVEREIALQKACHEATETEQYRPEMSGQSATDHIADHHSGTTSSTIDTHCFYRKAQKEFCAAAWKDKNPSNSGPCSYVVFQHAEDTSTITSSSGSAYGTQLIDLVAKPRPARYHCELRIIMSPETRDEPYERHYLKSISSTPFPFDPATCEAFFKLCDFHKAFFEMSNSGHSHVIQNARVNTYKHGGTHSFFVGLGDTGRCNMKVFVSHKECDRVTTVFIHDCSASEKRHLQDRFMDKALQPLTLHPIFILVLIAERLQESLWRDVKNVYHDAKNQLEQVPTWGLEQQDLHKSIDAMAQSNLSLQISQTVHANQWRMGQLRDFIGNMKAWSREIEDKDPKRESSFRTACKVLDDRLMYLEGSLDEAHMQLTATLHYVSIYRHWLDVHIANSANNLNLAISKSSYSMSLDSRRDQSAVKAISVMSMVFLPATFFCGVFNLPFFDWTANRLSEVVLNWRIWIYVACVVGTTLIITFFWRVWFRFEKWRLSHGRSKNVRRDLKSWVKSGFKQIDKHAQALRERRKKKLLLEPSPSTPV